MQEWFLWWHSRSRWLFSVACQSKKWINLLFIWGLITLRHKRAGSTCLRKCHQCGCVATAEYKLAMGLQKWSCQIQCTWTPEFRVFFSQTESHDSFCVKRGCRSVLCNWPGTGGGIFTSQSTEVEEKCEAQLTVKNSCTCYDQKTQRNKQNF